MFGDQVGQTQSMTRSNTWTYIGIALGVLILNACSCDDTILVADTPGTCEPDYACATGTEYRNGECQPSRCGSDAECCPGQKCNVAAGFCSSQFKECDDDEACSEVPGQTCIDFRDGRFCGYPNKDNALTSAGTQACVVDTECDSGRACVGGRCVIFAPCEGGCADGEICDIDSNSCFAMPTCEAQCGEGQLAVVADPETMSGPQCCLVECACATLPPILPGQYGWNAEIAASAQTVAVSAYDAVYGDLIVAFYDDEGAELSVQYVDGFPTDGAIEANPNGGRGGRYGAGEDVGEHTSIVIDDQEVVHVAYYDRDNGRLKYANYVAGTWSSHVVDESAHVGRYTSIAIGPDGNPRIAYMMVEGMVNPIPEPQAGLRYATARTNMPASPSDWSVQIVDSRDVPQPICGGGCMSNQACVDLGAGPTCVAEAMGCMMCESDEACVDDAGTATCETEIGTVPLDSLPEGTGLFADLVMTSTGTAMIAYYDSIDGDLKLATQSGAGFSLQVLDGDDAMEPTNVGAHASIAVSDDGAQMGVAYFDVSKDDLVYLDLVSQERQVVDDGLMPPDLNMVGADASLVFDSFGNPAIAYQDPTNIDLVYARRLGSPAMWSHEAMRGNAQGGQPGTAAGFYACQARRGDKTFVGAVDVSFDDESNLVLDLSVDVRPLD